MSVTSHKKPPASIRRDDVHWNIETELEKCSTLDHARLRFRLSEWPSVKAKHVFKALLKIGWQVVSQRGSHIKLKHKSAFYPMYVWAFRDSDELGPKIL